MTGHNHPLVATPANGCRSMLLSQTPVSTQLAYTKVLVASTSFSCTKNALSGCVMLSKIGIILHGLGVIQIFNLWMVLNVSKKTPGSCKYLFWQS